METSDDRLLARARQGDGQAFADLAAPHLRRLRASIALRAPSPHLIDEIAHEAVVHAYRHLAEFDGGDLGAWLRSIAWHLLRAEVQRHARRQAQLSRYAQALLRQSDPPDDRSDEVARLRACLDALPGHLRGLVDQRYRDGLEPKAIAAGLRRSAEWVRTNLYRVRDRLRTCLEAAS